MGHPSSPSSVIARAGGLAPAAAAVKAGRPDRVRCARRQPAVHAFARYAWRRSGQPAAPAPQGHRGFQFQGGCMQGLLASGTACLQR